MTYKTLVNFEAAVFIITGIILVVLAILNEEEIAKKYGMTTWKEWWNYFKHH